MKRSVFLQGLAAVCIAATASAMSGQTNAIQLFSPANVRVSTQGTGYGANENVFNTTNLNLTCTAPIQAKISSSPDGTGNVLVDNFITLSVTAGSSSTSPSDVCLGGTVENGGKQENCFTSSYASQASEGKLTGQDPDPLVASGGVPPIDISSGLQPGAIQAKIGLVDTGGFLTSSTLYLVTNCTPGGVTGPAQVTGNPIPQNNPTDQQLAQSSSFNSTSSQQVQFTYDLTQAEDAGTLTIKDGTIPTTGDVPLNPATFQSTYLQNTSFATANCLIHTGELFEGSPACKIYTLTCQVGTNPDQSGTLCPVSLDRNEIFQEVFDGPSFTLPDIAVPNGPTFHQGIGLLEAKEGWTGGPCVFDSASASLANTLCPQNLLTTFSGPGLYKSGGQGQSPNSTFISVAPVPEDLTTIRVTGQQPGGWINSHNATVNFVSTPPAVPGNNSFVAAPILSLTYGISTASAVPAPPPPVSGDVVLTNPVACPAPGGGNSPAAAVFTPPAQNVSVAEDGQYLLHYFAQDCAGTEELKFTQTAGSWSTSFYTFPINVDTVAPVVLSGPTLSPAPSTNGGVANSYLIGQKVTATYRCTDDRSGIVVCGTSTYPPGTTLDTGNITSPVDTSKAGPATFTVNAVDAAGNQTTASVSYQVVAPPVNLAVLKLAPPLVKKNGLLTYAITAFNLGRQPASTVTITDPLPANVTFVQAQPCSNGSCSNSNSNSASCTFANDTVTCTTSSLGGFAQFLVEIQVTVQAAVGTKIKNTATLSSGNPESSPGNNRSTAITVVF
jgi:uncharacterized repeat protein (TIGR01451 family)